MGYNLLINGVYLGYNPLTNHLLLLTPWDIQVILFCMHELHELEMNLCGGFMFWQSIVRSFGWFQGLHGTVWHICLRVMVHLEEAKEATKVKELPRARSKLEAATRMIFCKPQCLITANLSTSSNRFGSSVARSRKVEGTTSTLVEAEWSVPIYHH